LLEQGEVLRDVLFQVGKAVFRHQPFLKGEMLAGEKDQVVHHLLDGIVPVALADGIGDPVDPLDDLAVLVVDGGDADTVAAFVPDQMMLVHGG
jgi:hypothetical protein